MNYIYSALPKLEKCMGVIMQSELGLVFVSIIMGDPEISLVSRLKNHLIFLKKYIKNTRRLIENDKKTC